MNPRSIIAVALSVLAQTALAEADGSAVGRGNRGLSLTLPEEVLPQEAAVLSVELDGYDVTTFSRLEGTQLAIDLQTPLAPGAHSLSLQRFLPDGSSEVLFETVVEAPALEGGEVSFNTALQTSYRTDHRPDEPFEPVDRATNTGSLSFKGTSASGRWQLASGVEAIYDRYNVAAPAGDSWMLPTYNLSAAWNGTHIESVARAGSIEVAREDLLFSRFKRRGAAFETVSKSGRFGMQAFALAARPRNAFDGDYLGPGDSDDRARGISASFAIVRDRLDIGGSYVDGDTVYGGAGFNPQSDAAVYGGSTWNLALDSRWVEGSVWLHLEHASSEFDADGAGLGLPAREDEATQARLRLSSDGGLGEGPFAYWSADLVHKRVGRDFYSIGNLSQAGNLEVHSARLQGGFESLDVEVELSRQRTNPEDDPSLARQTLRRAGIDLSWTPAMLDPESRLWSALGIPSVSGWFYHSRNEQPDADALIAGFDVDNTTRETGVALTFDREALSWTVELGLIDYEDRSEAIFDGEYLIYEPLSDSRNVQGSIQASWAPSSRVKLDAYLQRNDLDETEVGNEHRSTNYGLSGNFVLAADKLSLHVSAGRSDERRDFGDVFFWPERLRSRFASAQLSWALKEATDWPGLDLYVKGAYARNEDLAFFADEEQWSVYVGAAVTWERTR